jgi:hypothetical protein
MITEQKYVRDVTFKCDNLTLFEGIFLKTIVEAFQKGKQVKIETDEEFEARIEHERVHSR